MAAVVVFLLLVPILLCTVHAILNRLPGSLPHSTPFTAGKYALLLLLPAYVALHLNLFGAELASIVAGITFVLIYTGCVVFLNWFIFTLTDVSMHIQLLMQLSDARRMRIDELVARYNRNTILGNRVPRLLELGQLKLVNERLVLSGKSVLFGAAVCRILRRILGIPVRPELADHSS